MAADIAVGAIMKGVFEEQIIPLFQNEISNLH